MSKKLLADIGGTNIRLSISNNGRFCNTQKLQCADFDSLKEAILFYYAQNNINTQDIASAAICVACPVLSDKISLTNCHWNFSIKKLKKELNLEQLSVVNDFVAQALSIPFLSKTDIVQIKNGNTKNEQTIGVIGPGTGLGTAILLKEKSFPKVIACEGGHVSVSANNDKEAKIISLAWQEIGHVSAEKLLSGLGLPNLHKVLKKFYGQPIEKIDAAEIFKRAQNQDAFCQEVLDLFFSLFGTFCSNFALSCGCTGGIYISGGIFAKPENLEILQKSVFVKSFLDKGRFEGYLSQIPIYVVTHQNPALIGLNKLS